MKFRVMSLMLLVVIGWMSTGVRADVKKPNVIIIYTDDQGSIDANCYGSKDLITPTIDRLAKTGVRFTQMYSPSAICSASRAGLLTGQFPPRAGVPANVSSTKGQSGMPQGKVTIADMLKGAGYATGHVGKWHLGYTPETMPNGQGFDQSWGHMGGCIDNYSHFFYWAGPNRHDLWRNGTEIWEDGEYFGDSMVREANKFIEANKDKPFFLYWAINWPHYPLQGTAKWREAYKGLPSPRNKYAAFVSSMDERIGLVVDHVEKLGLREKTLIIFQSDHGHSVEERTFRGGGSAGIYRGYKGTLWEGGIRVPSIVSMPGTVPQNEVRNQLATGCDWFATIADICGADTQGQKPDGKSIREVIMSNEAPTPHKTFYWSLGDQAVVRDGDWKLLRNPRVSGGLKTKLFLANLSVDPTENKNFAEANPDVVKRLTSVMNDYAEDIRSSAPSRK